MINSWKAEYFILSTIPITAKLPALAGDELRFQKHLTDPLVLCIFCLFYLKCTISIVSSGVFQKNLNSFPFFTWIPPSRLAEDLKTVDHFKPAFPRTPTVPIWAEICRITLPKYIEKGRFHCKSSIQSLNVFFKKNAFTWLMESQVSEIISLPTLLQVECQGSK